MTNVDTHAPRPTTCDGATTELGCTFGLFLNLGANLAPTADAVFDLARRQAELADEAGYHDVWVTEHHFSRFGLNPSALTAAAFLLGSTKRVRVGTAVVVAPLRHPVELAENAAVLDQFSSGRFDLGLGRGGYSREPEVFGIDEARWQVEPETTAQTLLDLWAPDAERLAQPPPRMGSGHPPILLATNTPKRVEFAARKGLALQHHFVSRPSARIALERQYAEARAAAGLDGLGPKHLHTVIVLVTNRAARASSVRARLQAALAESFDTDNHPAAAHRTSRSVSHEVANSAIIGSSAEVIDELGQFIEAVSARRVAIFQEAIGDARLTVDSVERFATDVAPQLAARSEPSN